eukprot:53887_1
MSKVRFDLPPDKVMESKDRDKEKHEEHDREKEIEPLIVNAEGKKLDVLPSCESPNSLLHNIKLFVVRKMWTFSCIYILIQIGFHILSVEQPVSMEAVRSAVQMQATVRPPDWQVWRFVSLVLAHVNWAHLFKNVFALIVISWIESDFGAVWRMVVVCVTTAWGASAFWFIFDPRRMTANSVGSSGSVYGLYGAALSFVLLNMPTVNRKGWKLGLVMVYRPMTTTYSIMYGEKLAFLPHLGGWLVGVLVGAAVSRNVSSFPNWKNLIQWTARIMTGLVLLFMTFWCLTCD